MQRPCTGTWKARTKSSAAIWRPPCAVPCGVSATCRKQPFSHPRWTFHFTPTSSSWLNAVEGFFAKLTRRRLKHGVFRSVTELQAAINRFIAEHNEQPKPFVWRADPNAIIAARSRGFQALESIH